MTIDDIKVGNIVRVSQLQSIYNTHIFLADCKTIERGRDTKGRIVYIGSDVNSESDRILSESSHTYCFYKDGAEDDTDIDFIG